MKARQGNGLLRVLTTLNGGNSRIPSCGCMVNLVVGKPFCGMQLRLEIAYANRSPSSEVIERTLVYSGPRKDSRLAYFYFSFKDLEKQKTANLPRTLLAELILQTGVHEMPNEALFDFYEMHKHGMPPVKAVMDLLHKILNHGETFLIIDALDECPDNELERSDLCSMLETFHSWGCQGLHLLVTSRKAVYLAETLEGLVTQNPINICGAFLGGDIQKFIQSQLQFSKKHRKWPKSIRLEIEEALMQKADGM